MALTNLYALPTAVSLGSTTGWSRSSGGTPSGDLPGNGHAIIFDANSGAARTITGGTGSGGSGIVGTINTATSSGAMTFTGFFGLQAGDGLTYTSDFTGTVSIGDMTIYGTPTLKTTGIPVASLTQAGGSMTLGSNLLVTGAISLAGDFNAANYNVTCASFTQTSTTSLLLGTGDWTLTGTGIVWTVQASTNLVPSSSNIKITDVSAAGKVFIGAGKTYNNLWNNAVGSNMEIRGANTFNALKWLAGTTTVLPAGANTSAAIFTSDGTAGKIGVASSTPGSAATLTKTGGGITYFDSAAITDITAAPAATFRARNSTDGGNNANWTFIPGNSRLLQFF